MTTHATPLLYCIEGGNGDKTPTDHLDAVSPVNAAQDGLLYALSSDAIAALSDIRFAVKQFEDQAAAIEVLRTTAGILASMAVERHDSGD